MDRSKVEKLKVVKVVLPFTSNGNLPVMIVSTAAFVNQWNANCRRDFYDGLLTVFECCI